MSEWFEVKVGVHQGSVLSPLLFAIVMDAVTENVEKGMKEFLYADDLVIMGDSWEEVEEKFVRWKGTLESKGLKVNVNKTKGMRVGKKSSSVISAIDPCAICGKRAMRNSIQCVKCGYWVHKMCLGIKGKLSSGMNYECGSCNGVANDEEMKFVKFGRDEIVEFCYLRDMLEVDSASRAVTTRIHAEWKSSKNYLVHFVAEYCLVD